MTSFCPVIFTDSFPVMFLKHKCYFGWKYLSERFVIYTLIQVNKESVVLICSFVFLSVLYLVASSVIVDS